MRLRIPDMQAPDENTADGRTRRALWRLRWVIYVGLIFASSSALRFLPDSRETVSAVSVTLMIALASLAIGSVVGFLFGVPRVHSDPSQADGRSYVDNTNLEQVADWLTKILIGFGLAQLTNIPPALGQLSLVTGAALGEGPEAAPLVGSTVLFFLSVGFIYGYLWSRLEMMPALIASERAIDRLQSVVAEVKTTSEQVQSVVAEVRTTSEQVQSVVAEVRTTSEQDLRALFLVGRTLESSHGVPLQTLVEALKDASPKARLDALMRATDHRRRTHQIAMQLPPTDEARRGAYLGNMARCIPVLRALVGLDWADTTDPSLEYRAHAQLGYALKDRSKPANPASSSWANAISELSTAIRLRDQAHAKDALYELNRAMCLIAWKPEDVEPILKDLEIVMRDGTYAREVSEPEGRIWPWLVSQTADSVVGAWLKEHARRLAGRPFNPHSTRRRRAHALDRTRASESRGPQDAVEATEES